jgi:hypothetical protein
MDPLRVGHLYAVEPCVPSLPPSFASVQLWSALSDDVVPSAWCGWYIFGFLLRMLLRCCSPPGQQQSTGVPDAPALCTCSTQLQHLDIHTNAAVDLQALALLHPWRRPVPQWQLPPLAQYKGVGYPLAYLTQW